MSNWPMVGDEFTQRTLAASDRVSTAGQCRLKSVNRPRFHRRPLRACGEDKGHGAIGPEFFVCAINIYGEEHRRQTW